MPAAATPPPPFSWYFDYNRLWVKNLPTLRILLKFAHGRDFGANVPYNRSCFIWYVSRGKQNLNYTDQQTAFTSITLRKKAGKKGWRVGLAGYPAIVRFFSSIYQEFRQPEPLFYLLAGARFSATPVGRFLGHPLCDSLQILATVGSFL